MSDAIKPVSPAPEGPRTEQCWACSGTGVSYGTRCTSCGGQGVVVEPVPPLPAPVSEIWSAEELEREPFIQHDGPTLEGLVRAAPECKVCGGRGYVVNEGGYASACYLCSRKADPPTPETPVSHAALIAEIEQGIEEMKAVCDSWKSLVTLPHLTAGQNRTIDLLRRCKAALQPRKGEADV